MDSTLHWRGSQTHRRRLTNARPGAIVYPVGPATESQKWNINSALALVWTAPAGQGEARRLRAPSKPPHPGPKGLEHVSQSVTSTSLTRAAWGPEGQPAEQREKPSLQNARPLSGGRAVARRRPHLPSLFARRFRRPRIWAMRMPTVMKSWGTTPRAPLRFLGDSSPRYIGTTLEDRPGGGETTGSGGTGVAGPGRGLHTLVLTQPSHDWAETFRKLPSKQTPLFILGPLNFEEGESSLTKEAHGPGPHFLDWCHLQA